MTDEEILSVFIEKKKLLLKLPSSTNGCAVACRRSPSAPHTLFASALSGKRNTVLFTEN